MRWREPESFKDLGVRRKVPKNWEREQEVKEEEGLGRTLPRKPFGERILEGRLWEPLKLKLLATDPVVNLTDSAAIFFCLASEKVSVIVFRAHSLARLRRTE